MTNTLMEEKMTEAINNKNNNVNNFIWKDGKVKDANGNYKQNERKLITMSEAELKQCYSHCKTMLFNKDAQNPGRYTLLDILSVQRNKCGAELFLRYLEREKNISKFSFRETINTFLNNNRDAFKDVIPSLGDMVIVPNEYERIPLSDIMDGCLGSLGVFNKKHITRTFILKQGIWLTATEAKELVENDAEGVLIDRLEIIRERLNLKEIEKLWINSKGLTFTQMRAMLQLKPNKKYGELTTAQLETLRYRILFNLEEAVEEHITAWEQRMEQIEQIALLKQISLSRI